MERGWSEVVRRGFLVMGLVLEGNGISDGMFVCNTLRMEQDTSVLLVVFAEFAHL